MSRTYRRKNIPTNKHNSPFWSDVENKSFYRDSHIWRNHYCNSVKEHTNMSERAYIRNSLHKVKYDNDYDIINYKKYYKGLIWYYD